MKRLFLEALGRFKEAAAQANESLGLLSSEESHALRLVASEVAEGKWDSHFPSDTLQGFLELNALFGRIVANRARSISDLEGSDLVSLSSLNQSSNDVLPTVVHIASLICLRDRLIPALQALETTLVLKADQFRGMFKVGRTHLQDDLPIGFDQVFRGFAGQIQRGGKRLKLVEKELSEVPLGGGVVGTGHGVHKDFALKSIAYLNRSLELSLEETDNHFASQNNIDLLLSASGATRTVAAALYKVANDIRFMGSGPRAGFGELDLPAVQPGSSIMPGKVNPVIAEALLMVVAQVFGNDSAVLHAIYGSNFEHATFLPVASRNFLESLVLLANAVTAFTEKCLSGIQVANQ